MTRFRFTLTSLMGLVVTIALGLAALRVASRLWSSATFTVCVGVLLVGVLGGLFRSGETRSFWVGFTVLGWFYLILVFGPWLRDHIGDRLLTTAILDYLHPRLLQPAGPSSNLPGATVPTTVVSRSSIPGGSIVQADGTFQTPAGPVVRIAPRWEYFQEIGHSIWAMLIALMGGMLGRYFYSTRTTPAERTGGPQG